MLGDAALYKSTLYLLTNLHVRKTSFGVLHENCQFLLFLGVVISVSFFCALARVFTSSNLVSFSLSVKRTASELPESCFTFSKQTIHCEPSEKIRHTGRARGRHFSATPSHKELTKVTEKEGPTVDLDYTVPRKKAKQSESGSSLAKRSGSDVEVLPPTSNDSRRPRSIMILPDADISEHEIAGKQNPDAEDTGYVAEDLCTQRASSVEERSHFYCATLLIVLYLWCCN